MTAAMRGFEGCGERPSTSEAALAPLLLLCVMLTGCATERQPQFRYDADVPPLPPLPAAVTDDRPKPLLIPPAWTPARGGKAAAKTASERVESANAAARVEPRREGYFNAVQIYPWSEGALYQVYAAPGQITDIALEAGESLVGPIAAGDTARWILGDTESGSGTTRRTHVLVKPSRAGIATNLVITTDRRIYLIELHSGEKPYMPSVAWAYPQPPASNRRVAPAIGLLPGPAARHYRYRLKETRPPGGLSRFMTTVAASMSSSLVASYRARCRRSSSAVQMVNPRSSTRASIGMS